MNDKNVPRERQNRVSPGVVVQGNNNTVIFAGGKGAQAAGPGSVLAGGIDGNVTADNRRIEKESRDQSAKKKRKEESPTAGPVFDQRDTTVHGNQYNVGGDLNIHGTTGHAGATGAGAPPAAGTAPPFGNTTQATAQDKIPSIVELCPKCLEALENLAKDPVLKPFLDQVVPGGVRERLRNADALQVLRDIDQALDAGSRPPVDKLMNFLAALAPLQVPAIVVAETRHVLGVESTALESRPRRGGIVAIGADTLESADAIIRGAIFDWPCVWDWRAAHESKGYEPEAGRRLDALNVPGRSTVGAAEQLQERIQQTCRGAKDFEGALKVLHEWLVEEHRPMIVLCAPEIKKLLSEVTPSTVLIKGATISFEQLALFLQFCGTGRTDIQVLYDKLCTIVERLMNIRKEAP